MPAPNDDELQELYVRSIERVLNNVRKGKYRIISINNEQKIRKAAPRTRNAIIEMTPTGEFILTMVYKTDEKKTGR